MFLLLSEVVVRKIGLKIYASTAQALDDSDSGPLLTC